MARKIPVGYHLVPPDGGWGWMVVAGTCLAGLLISGPLQAIGLMLRDIMEQMNATTTDVGWIPSIAVATAQFIAPFNALLINGFSCRVALFLGGISCSAGMILSSCVNTVQTLYITFGIFTGASLGIVTNASFVVLSKYFKRHYGLVTGILMASFSSGKLIFAPIIQMLIGLYSLQGVFLILGGVMLNVCVGAALCQPEKWHYILVPVEETNTLTQDDDDDGKTVTGSTHGKYNNKENASEMKDPEAAKFLPIPNGKQPNGSPGSSWDIVQTLTSPSDGLKSSVRVTAKAKACWSNNRCASSCIRGPLRTLRFSLMKEPIFYVLLFSGLLNYIPSVFVGVFTPSLGIQNGLLPMQAAVLTSARSAGEIVGRVSSPWLLERFALKLDVFYISLSAVHGVLLIVITLTTNFPLMIFVCVISGVVHGGFSGLQMLTIVDCVGVANLSATLALTQFSQGFFSVGIGPTLGFLRDVVGNFSICFYMMAVAQFLLCIIWSLKHIAVRNSDLSGLTTTS